MRTVRYIGVLDDEIIAVRGMVFQLEKLLPNAEVKGFTQYREFELWCENNTPELVFLDMEMPQAMGLDVAKRIQADVGNIVFVTAHSHYSLEAFETAVDYILKPISPKAFAASPRESGSSSSCEGATGTKDKTAA